MAVGVDILRGSMKKTLVPEKLYSKGYDNSGANDEEVNDVVNIAMMRRKQKRRGRRIRNRGKGRRKRLAEEEFRHRNFGRGLCRNINCLDIAGSKTRDLRCNLRLGKWHLWVA